MQQTSDFISECAELSSLLDSLQAQDWERKTQFEQWTINNILTHLHFWNLQVDLSLTDPEQFIDKMQNEVLPSIMSRGFRTTEDEQISERGTDLLAAWQDTYRAMQARWSTLDPKQRVKWAGPDMSVRSAMTARQMETWAHAQAIYDVLGLERDSHDRIANVVVMGVNTFAWSFKTHQRAVPSTRPQLKLTLPSGKLLTFEQQTDQAGLIEGDAVEFAQVVTQTRNIADTQLHVSGDIATQWMAIAQCFAGGAVMPPAPGTRYRMTTTRQ